MLCDRLVVELNENRMQNCLLAESKLTFEKAYELVQAMKMADHDVKELQETPAATINKLNRDTSKDHLACRTSISQKHSK